MKIENCGFCGTKQACPFYITEIHDDGQNWDEFNVCAECGKMYQQALENKQKKQVDLTYIETPAQLIEFIESNINLDKRQKPSFPACQCGMTVANFEKHGRFGCAQCYDHFHEFVEKIVFPYHGASEHTGKKPLSIYGDGERLKTLRLRLAQALELERYEDAAVYKRDIEAILAKQSTSDEASDSGPTVA